MRAKPPVLDGSNLAKSVLKTDIYKYSIHICVAYITGWSECTGLYCVQASRWVAVALSCISGVWRSSFCIGTAARVPYPVPSRLRRGFSKSQQAVTPHCPISGPWRSPFSIGTASRVPAPSSPGFWRGVESRQQAVPPPILCPQRCVPGAESADDSGSIAGRFWCCSEEHDRLSAVRDEKRPEFPYFQRKHKNSTPGEYP